VLRAQVYAIAAHSSPRCPPRSAAERRRRSEEGAPWHAPQRGRSREGAARLAGTGASRVRTGIGRPRHTPPSCVTGPTPSLATGTGAGTVHGSPNSVPGFSDRCNCNEKSVMTAYTAPTFPRYSATAVSAPHPQPRGGSPPTAVHLRARRRRRYVDAPAPVGTGPPPRLPEPPDPSPRPWPTPGRSGPEPSPMPVPAVAVPRVLPGFSGFSQVSHPLYL
jgi:hypothetical protein